MGNKNTSEIIRESLASSMAAAVENKKETALVDNEEKNGNEIAEKKTLDELKNKEENLKGEEKETITPPEKKKRYPRVKEGEDFSISEDGSIEIKSEYLEANFKAVQSDWNKFLKIYKSKNGAEESELLAKHALNFDKDDLRSASENAYFAIRAYDEARTKEEKAKVLTEFFPDSTQYSDGDEDLKKIVYNIEKEKKESQKETEEKDSESDKKSALFDVLKMFDGKVSINDLDDDFIETAVSENKFDPKTGEAMSLTESLKIALLKMEKPAPAEIKEGGGEFSTKKVGVVSTNTSAKKKSAEDLMGEAIAERINSKRRRNNN